MVPDVEDDERPYELARDCGVIPRWSLGRFQHPSRVAATSAGDAWITVGMELLHLTAEGRVEREPFDGINDVWRCPAVTWIVGAGGLVARKPDGGSWQRLDLEPAIVQQVVESGTGCDDDVWVGAGRDVRVHDGDGWRAISIAPTDIGDGTLHQNSAVMVRSAGHQRIATSGSGETLAYVPTRDAFVPIGGTDDITTDLIVFRDGTGASLHAGYALSFDATMTTPGPKGPDLGGYRASRRSDVDVWIARGDTVSHFDGTSVAIEAVPVAAEDVDAHFDAVWVVGYGGAAVLTQAGWCHVLTVAPE